MKLIRELVSKRKISISDFCEQVGISDQALRNIEKRNSTKTEILEKIAEVLNVPVGYFFGETQPLVVNGGNNQLHNGNGHQIILSKEEIEIEHLRDILSEKDKIIAEKERLIQILLKKES